LLDLNEAGELCECTTDDQWEIAEMAMHGGRVEGAPSDEQQHANARRLVACWNACAGVEDLRPGMLAELLAALPK
jgi:hypothetical protein